MGYDRAEITVSARLSRHNDERDAEHDKLWEDLVAEIEKLTEQSKYGAIQVWRS